MRRSRCPGGALQNPGETRLVRDSDATSRPLGIPKSTDESGTRHTTHPKTFRDDPQVPSLLTGPVGEDGTPTSATQSTRVYLWTDSESEG